MILFSAETIFASRTSKILHLNSSYRARTLEMEMEVSQSQSGVHAKKKQTTQPLRSTDLEHTTSFRGRKNRPLSERSNCVFQADVNTLRSLGAVDLEDPPVFRERAGARVPQLSCSGRIDFVSCSLTILM